MEITPEWLAGFFDGEGGVMLNINPRLDKGKFRVQPELSITQKKREILDEIRELGFGHLSKNQRAWNLRISSAKEIKSFISLVKPFVHLKKKHLETLEEVLELRSNHQGRTFSGEEWSKILDLTEKLRDLNSSSRNIKLRKYTISELKQMKKGDLH